MPTSKVGSLETLVPEQQADDDEEQLLPSFPALVTPDDVEGYEKIGPPGELSYQPAPKPEGYAFDPDAGIKTFEQLPKVTEQILRDILLQYASELCCQGRQFIRDMPITKIETTLAWHYGLETYMEARYTCWTFEPYTDQEVDGRDNGRPPGPWELVLKPNRPFEDEDKEVTVPHTCRLKPCHHCAQAGSLTCPRCKGRRYLKCGDCAGQGKRMVVQGAVSRRVACSACDGQGRKKCPTCRANGEIECPTCRGRQRLLFYVKLKCEWRRRDTDFIEEKTDLPDELVRDVSGKLIFLEEDDSQVCPIQNFPYASVNEASAKLLQEHERNYRGQRVSRQRHWLRGVPVTECHYLHNGRPGVFFVYGFENKLFLEEFPRSACCSSCELL